MSNSIPNQIFWTTLGTSLGKIVQPTEVKDKTLKINSLRFKFHSSVASDLTSLKLPSNEDKFMDGKQETALFKINIQVY